MGIFKLNGIDYMGGGGGGNTNYEELTQLEYDALTEEEKNNGTIYFITDTNSNQDGKFQPIIYSENEREIGVWTDGKPLYQKTYIAHNITTDTEIDLNIPNIEIVVNQWGTWDRTMTNGIWTYDLNAVNELALQTNFIVLCRARLDTNKLYIGYSSTTAYSTIPTVRCTLQYTKSTDFAGSGKWTPQGVPAHHYSTEEQIVGTWVDGSTMYEKTYVGTIGNYDSSIDGYLISADIDVTTIKELINIDGSLKSIDTAPAFASLNGLKNTSNWSADIHINRYGILLWTGNSSYGSKFAGGKAVVTIRYTKQSPS